VNSYDFSSNWKTVYLLSGDQMRSHCIVTITASAATQKGQQYSILLFGKEYTPEETTSQNVIR